MKPPHSGQLLLSVACLGLLCLGAPPDAKSPNPQDPAAFHLRGEDEAFLDRLERATFQYFWREADPRTGLVKDRSTPSSPCSIAAVGFGLSAINIAIERGWIDRDEGLRRTLGILDLLAEAPQNDAPGGSAGSHGWFYHFLDPQTALRTWGCELSSIDTALLLAGVLDAREFFGGQTSGEQRVRRRADFLVGRIDWAWMADGGATFTMGWRPETGFIPSRWVGYNEAKLLYLLALGADPSLSSGQPRVTWEAWTTGYTWRTLEGESYTPFPPLFGHQYTECWVDFRGMADEWGRRHRLTYFENSRRATVAQQAYCRANPGHFANYGPMEWGITACDGPAGYAARGAPPAENDDGTLAPTAPGGSLAFAPEACLPALRRMAEVYGDKLWGPYGFRDAYNATRAWFASDTLGIDQGPILLMSENLRTGSVWRRMSGSAVLKRGLERAGFTPANFP